MTLKRYSPLLLFTLLLAFSALACQALVPGSSPIPNLPTVSNQPIQVAATVPAPVIASGGVDNEEQALISVYAQANGSVVNITVYAQGDQGLLVPQGQGSGFVYDSNGYVLTNAHVVNGSDAIEVTFSNGLTRKASLRGEDLNSDLAVVQVEDMPDGIPALPLGRMEDLVVGQTVIAIGNPFGLSGTLTRGVISALGRSIPALTPFSIPQSIQTDAPINPGNSGGPLLNLRGEVIGVNAQIETDGESRTNSGIGFAIPISIVRRVAPQLIAQGRYDWPWLGLAGRDMSREVAQEMKLPVETGAYVSEVVGGGPAANAGLRGSTGQATVDGHVIEVGGDVIIAANGQPIRSFDDMLIFLSLNGSPGDKVTLTILRNGQQQEVVVELGTRPQDT